MKIMKNSFIFLSLVCVLVFGVIILAIYSINNTKDFGHSEVVKQISPFPNNDILDKDAEIDSIESSISLYQGVVTNDLMPIDLTFSKLDVPNLIDKLNSSKYKAFYLDSDRYLCVTNDNAVQVSTDNGENWQVIDTENIEAKEFALWLLKNDPNPGYSVKEMQNRLENRAEVKHIVFEDGKEIYIVIDENGVQLELVQLEKLDTVLLDSQRIMITSKGGRPLNISKQKLELFYNLLVSNDILTNTLAEQDYFEIVSDIEKNSINFTLSD